MTGPANRPDDLLHDALVDRAERTAFDPTPVTTVAARAGRMRRRRRGAVAGVVAAVALAVVVPTLALQGSGERGVEPANPADSAPPSIGYAFEGVYHSPDGSTTDVPKDITSVTPLGSSLLVTDDPGMDGPLHEIRLEADGTRARQLTASLPVVGADGSVAHTVVDDRGAITLLVDDADGSRVGTVALEGRRAGAVGLDTARGRVVVIRASRSDVAYSSIGLAGGGSEPIDLPGDGRAGAYNGTTGRFIVFTDTEAVVSSVVGSDGSELWGSDDGSVFLGGFSPGGRYVTSSGPDDEFQVRDAATGDLVTEFPHDAPDGSDALSRFRTVVWEDETHLVGLEQGRRRPAARRPPRPRRRRHPGRGPGARRRRERLRVADPPVSRRAELLATDPPPGPTVVT